MPLSAQVCSVTHRKCDKEETVGIVGRAIKNDSYSKKRVGKTMPWKVPASGDELKSSFWISVGLPFWPVSLPLLTWCRTQALLFFSPPVATTLNVVFDSSWNIRSHSKALCSVDGHRTEMTAPARSCCKKLSLTHDCQEGGREGDWITGLGFP